MDQSNQVRVKRKKGDVGLFSGDKPIAMFRYIEIPSTIPSGPHVNKWVNVRGKVARDTLHCAIAGYLPLIALQREVEKMKAKPRNADQYHPTSAERH
jgi:hypothetical protein